MGRYLEIRWALKALKKGKGIPSMGCTNRGRKDFRSPFRQAKRTGIQALLLPLLAPVASVAQEVVAVQDPPTCQGCEITFEHVVTLGDREGPGRVMPPNATAIDSKGNFYLGHGDGSSRVRQVWVFSPEGEFLRTFGREGEGPGEYENIALMEMLQGDTLEIYDQRLRRRTILAPDLTVLSTSAYKVGTFWRSVRLPDGRLAVNEHLQTPERIGYPFQLIDQSGEIVRSFGMVKPEYREGESDKYRRLVTRGPDGGSVWTLGSGDYLMELWDTTGVRLKALQRDAEWFERRLVGRPVTVDGPTPLALLRYVRSDSKGRLWISGLVAKNDWRDLATADPDFASSALGFMELFEPIIEVVDPETGELLASEVFPDLSLGGFLGEDMIITYKEDAMGYPLLDIWRIRLLP